VVVVAVLPIDVSNDIELFKALKDNDDDDDDDDDKYN
jgi:hypothetical protein